MADTVVGTDGGERISSIDGFLERRQHLGPERHPSRSSHALFLMGDTIYNLTILPHLPSTPACPVNHYTKNHVNGNGCTSTHVFG